MVEEQERCSYVLPLKKRKCRMLVKKGKRFCGEHAIYDPDQQGRIRCPNDPKHTVDKAELEEHLAKRCNSRVIPEHWIAFNSNVVEVTGRDESDECKIGLPSGAELFRMRDVVEKAYVAIAPLIEERILHSQHVEEHLLANQNLSAVHRKHLHQLSSIIGNMMAAKLVSNDASSCVVDLGAGKAQLSFWMARASPNTRFLLVDRMGCRNKHENKARQEDGSLRISRLRCSIEHLDLSKVESIQDASGVVAVCKHLCGTGTDYGVRCISNAIRNGMHVKGFALAPCCHHKSSFTQYTGKEFLSEHNIDGETDFNVLRYLATWAVCGMKRAAHQQTDHNTKVDGASLGEGEARGKDVMKNPTSWSGEEKEALGRKAKAILEMGRARHLESLGYGIAVYRYVHHATSPENLLIVGTRSESIQHP